MHESLLAFRKRRYLWVALLLVASSIAAYWYHDPQEPPNGGTVLGYTLGTLGALLILWLAWFGVRKRSYASTLGTVQGWLSAHIYLGLALIVVVLLHAGFQFGSNVHTLAFVLMMLVILSGVFGVVVYLRYPEQMSRNRGGAPPTSTHPDPCRTPVCDRPLVRCPIRVWASIPCASWSRVWRPSR